MIDTKKIISVTLVLILLLVSAINIYADNSPDYTQVFPLLYEPKPRIDETKYFYEMLFRDINGSLRYHVSNVPAYLIKNPDNTYTLEYRSSSISLQNKYIENIDGNCYWITELSTSYQYNLSSVVWSNYNLLDYSTFEVIYDKAYNESIDSGGAWDLYYIEVGDVVNIKNNTGATEEISIDATNATYQRIWKKTSSSPMYCEDISSDTSIKTIYIEPGEAITFWEIKAGYIILGLHKDTNLSLEIIRKSESFPTQTETPDIGYSATPKPQRINYEDGVFGSLNFAIDTLIYWISYPFVAIARLFESFMDAVGDTFAWIDSFTALVGRLFGWLPEPIQGILLVAVSAQVISLIIRVFRGS